MSAIIAPVDSIPFMISSRMMLSRTMRYAIAIVGLTTVGLWDLMRNDGAATASFVAEIAPVTREISQ
jgi:hypothetical protein